MAVVYSIQFPSDDRSCARYASGDECLAKRTLLDSSVSLCAWEASRSSGGTGAGTTHECIWIKPEFNARQVIIISLIVLILTVPIRILFRGIFMDILLAPTQQDVHEKEKITKVFRDAAISLLQCKGD